MAIETLNIAAGLVKELFEYRDGALYWLTKSRWGKRAGTVNGSGRRQVCIAGTLYMEHRIIFLWHHGYLPSEVDHADGNPLNNRIENLRPATHSQNNMNTGVRKDNTSGEKGVSWVPSRQQYAVYCFKDGKKLYGSPAYTSDYAVAVQSVRQLREEHHGMFVKHK